MRWRNLIIPLFSLALVCWLSGTGIDIRAQGNETSDQSGTEQAPLREGPRLLSAGESGIGRWVPDFSFVDIAGQSGKLSDFSDRKATVIAMTGTGCPLCKKYSPTLADLEQRYADQGVGFLYINPNQSEKLERLADEVQEKGFSGPYIRDDQDQITRLLDVKTTTEVFVLDKARTLVYRGAVDDQYGFGYALDAPRRAYLVDALDAVLAGESPRVEATSSPGCDMFYSDQTAAPKLPEVTYHNRISRIIQHNCLECHRDDSVAPMPLTTYTEVADYAGMIRRVVSREIMPPWFAANNDADVQLADGVADDAYTVSEIHTPLWANDRSLSTSEKSDLIHWVEAGAPEGDPADAALPRSFPNGWLIGQPDAEYSFPEAIPIKATGILPYKNIVVETDLTEDKWVRAIEVVPGDRSVVHHVLVFVLPPSDGSGNDQRSGDGINYWGIYVPGNSTQVYPAGYARRLPKGSRLKFQMHYTTNGKATEDLTKIGLMFANEPPRYEVKTASIVNAKFKIPPGDDHFRVVEPFPIPSDVVVLGYLPHHHLRGKACRYELTTPSGEKELLLDVPRYDFNWQLFYQYAQPKRIAKGSRIDFTGWYDNSDKNPANPDPTRWVRWGQQTDDEMHVGYIEYVVASEDIDQTQPEGSSDRKPEGDPNGELFQRLDVDGDGLISKAEVRQRMPGRATALNLFDRLDRNGDGKLDRQEVAQLRNRGAN